MKAPRGNAMVNRKLVRPNLAEIKGKMAKPAIRDTPPPRESRDRDNNGGPHHRRRLAPPDNTNAEAFYYLKQMNQQTPMIVVLDNGEQLRGHIEWYDRGCLKVHREDASNVLVFKHCIRYLYKEEEERSDA
jgi:host factor-I protein